MANPRYRNLWSIPTFFSGIRIDFGVQTLGTEKSWRWKFPEIPSFYIQIFPHSQVPWREGRGGGAHFPHPHGAMGEQSLNPKESWKNPRPGRIKLGPIWDSGRNGMRWSQNSLSTQTTLQFCEEFSGIWASRARGASSCLDPPSRWFPGALQDIFKRLQVQDSHRIFWDLGIPCSWCRIVHPAQIQPIPTPRMIPKSSPGHF